MSHARSVTIWGGYVSDLVEETQRVISSVNEPQSRSSRGRSKSKSRKKIKRKSGSKNQKTRNSDQSPREGREIDGVSTQSQDIDQAISVSRMRHMLNSIEQQNRELPFDAEEQRIRSGQDDFLPQLGQSRAELSQLQNKKKLDKEENTLKRQKISNMQQEKILRLERLRRDAAALKIQSLWRGILSRREASRLRSGLISNPIYFPDGRLSVWQQVSNINTGEIWFVNSVSLESQWNPPDFIRTYSPVHPNQTPQTPNMSQSPIYSRSRPSSLPTGDLPPLPSTHRATSASAISNNIPRFQSNKSPKCTPTNQRRMRRSRLTQSVDSLPSANSATPATPSYSPSSRSFTTQVVWQPESQHSSSFPRISHFDHALKNNSKDLKALWQQNSDFHMDGVSVSTSPSLRAKLHPNQHSPLVHDTNLSSAASVISTEDGLKEMFKNQSMQSVMEETTQAILQEDSQREKESTEYATEVVEDICIEEPQPQIVQESIVEDIPHETDPNRFFLPDGSAHVLTLRETVRNTVRVTQFDSVSTLLASQKDVSCVSEKKKKKIKRHRKRTKSPSKNIDSHSLTENSENHSISEVLNPPAVREAIPGTKIGKAFSSTSSAPSVMSDRIDNSMPDTNLVKTKVEGIEQTEEVEDRTVVDIEFIKTNESPVSVDAPSTLQKPSEECVEEAINTESDSITTKFIPETSVTEILPPKSSTQSAKQRSKLKEMSVHDTKTKEICFNCWSKGQSTMCELHKDNTTHIVRGNDSVIMCSNWKLESLMRKYRHEDLQEVFSKTNASVRWNPQHRTFATILELKHPVYRAHRRSQEEFWRKTWIATRFYNWIRSFVDVIRAQITENSKSTSNIRLNDPRSFLRLRSTFKNLSYLRNLTNKVSNLQPQGRILDSSRLLHLFGYHVIDAKPPGVKSMFEYESWSQLSKREFPLAPPPPVQVWCCVLLGRGPITISNEREFTKHLSESSLTQSNEQLSKALSIPSFDSSLIDGLRNTCMDVVVTAVDSVLHNFHSYQDSISQLLSDSKPKRQSSFLFGVGSAISWWDDGMWKDKPGEREKSEEIVRVRLIGEEKLARSWRDFNQLHIEHDLQFDSTDFCTVNHKELDGADMSLACLSSRLKSNLPVQFGGFYAGDKLADIPIRLMELTYISIPWDAPNQKPVCSCPQPNHRINDRIIPTVVCSASIFEDDPCFYGHNRPVQTNEEEYFGFRTATPAYIQAIVSLVDSFDFVPTIAAVKPNPAQPENMFVSKADERYPFPTLHTRANTSMDYIYVLQNTQASIHNTSKFTHIGVQDPGEWGKKNKFKGNMGLLRFEIFRSIPVKERVRHLLQLLDATGEKCWYNMLTGEVTWQEPALTKTISWMDSETQTHEDPEVELMENVEVDASFEKVISYRKHFSLSKEQYFDHIPALEAKANQTQSDFETHVSSPNSRISHPKSTVDPISPLRSTNQQKISSKQMHSPKTSMSEILAESDDHLKKTEIQVSEPKTESIIDRTNDVESISDTKESVNSIVHTERKYDESEDEVEDEDIARVLKMVDCAIPTIEQKFGQNRELLGRELLSFGVGLGIGIARSLAQKLPVIAMKDSSALIKEKDDAKVDEKAKCTELSDSRHDVSPTVQNIDCVQPEINQTIQEKGIQIEPTLTPDEVEFQAATSQSEEKMKDEDIPLVSEKAARLASKRILTRSAPKTPVDFVQNVHSTLTGGMHVDFLPNPLNVNKVNNIGVVRPRSVLEDWKASNFDPWSSGKNAYNTIMISSITQAVQEADEFNVSADRIAEATVSTQLEQTLELESGIAAVLSKAANADMDNLHMLMSWCRHGKYVEISNALDEVTMPIDFKDEIGNTLFLVAAQNGNKKVAKLCLRRGADMNAQNINGQTALHYCYAYGFEDLANYLIEKGADDTIRNTEGLTCYEGLSLADITGI